MLILLIVVPRTARPIDELKKCNWLRSRDHAQLRRFGTCKRRRLWHSKYWYSLEESNRQYNRIALYVPYPQCSLSNRTVPPVNRTVKRIFIPVLEKPHAFEGKTYCTKPCHYFICLLCGRVVCCDKMSPNTSKEDKEWTRQPMLHP